MRPTDSANRGQARYDARGPADASLASATSALAASIRSAELACLKSPSARGSGPSEAPGGEQGRAWLGASDLAGVREIVELVRRLMFPGFFDPDPIADAELDGHVARLS